MRRLTGVVVGTFVLSMATGCASQLDRGVAEFQQGKYDKAASLWTPLAKSGDPVAQHNVAVLWERGLGSTPLNLTEAAAWYSLSAESGHTPAMVSLARIQRQYAYDEEALSWLTRAAQSGNQEAVNDLRTWGKPVPLTDVYQTGLGSEEPKQLEQADVATARLTSEVAVGAVDNNAPAVLPPTDIGWPASLEASRRSLKNVAPNTLVEVPHEMGDVSDPADEHDLGLSADRTRYATGGEAEARDDSISIPGATAIAEWIIGLTGLGGSAAER